MILTLSRTLQALAQETGPYCRPDISVRCLAGRSVQWEKDLAEVRVY